MTRATSLSLFLCSMLTLVGCVDDSVSVFVRGNIKPTKEDGECLYESGDQYKLTGTYDVAGGRDYQVFLDVTNQLRSRGTFERAETNGVFITRADITLYGSDGTLINPADLGNRPNPFSITTPQTYIPPSPGADSLGSSSVRVGAIPLAYGEALRTTYLNEIVTVGIRLFGRTNGDIDIETGEWTWDVQICDTCLRLPCNFSSDDFVQACTFGVDERFYDRDFCRNMR